LKGKNILELFYSDIERWAYTFQHVTLMTRINNTTEVLKRVEGTNAVVVMERSILTDRHVFAEMLKKQGKLNPLEWDLYVRWYDLLTGFVPVDGIIHVNTDVDTCIERIAARARPGEVTPVEYLNDLHNAHEEWLAEATHPVLTLSTTDGSTEAERVANITNFLEELRQKRDAVVDTSVSAFSTPVKGVAPAEQPISPNAVNELADVVSQLNV
jgi:deoxyadenosine/deoxycytidine kinase